MGEALTEAQIETLFTYNPPDDVQRVSYEAIRVAARTFAGVLLRHTPVSADQSAALRKVREAVMTANASIALNGKL